MSSHKRPFILYAQEVRAIFRGRQRQIRRPVYPQPIREGQPWPTEFSHVCWEDILEVPFQYSRSGRPGDRLWVKEAWRMIGGAKGKKDPQVEYEATWPSDRRAPEWNTPLTMPQWASRITLEITQVRLQRLQEISNEDSFVQGVSVAPELLTNEAAQAFNRRHGAKNSKGIIATIFAQTVWNPLFAIRGHAWESNPWVWAYDVNPVVRIAPATWTAVPKVENRQDLSS